MARLKYGSVETAVVYEDWLPWKPDAGVCFQIAELQELVDYGHALSIRWVIELGDRKYAAESRTEPDATDDMLDKLRKAARLDMLYRAHNDGVI